MQGGKQMTINSERYNAMNNTRDFLDYVGYTKGVRVPKEIKERARRLLKHFPENYWIEEARKKLGDW
jgi:hypothetical protein